MTPSRRAAVIAMSLMLAAPAAAQPAQVVIQVWSFGFAPAQSGTATEMISIDPAEIAVAHERDQAFEP